MKNQASAVMGILGGVLSYLVGGFDTPLLALILCMAIDYATGLIVAGVFHRSPKSSNGGLESDAGWKGLARKFVTVLIVVVAHLTDLLLGVCYIRDAVVIGFCANEIISILENAGLMGLGIPEPIKDAIDLLMRRSEDTA